jgi:hypothetical protein
MIKSNLDTVNRKNAAHHLFDYELELIGKTRVDLLDVEDFKKEWSLTRNQYDIFREYSINTLKKVYKFRKERALETFEWFYKEFGLKIKN